MNFRKLHNISSKIHKWAAITIGIQVLLWVAGGFVMSWFNIDDVRGSYLRNELEPAIISSEKYNISVLNQFIRQSDRPVISAKLESLNGKLIYKLTYHDGGVDILGPKNAEKLSPFSESYIRKAAVKLYSGSSQISHLELLQRTGIEYRGSLPVWKVDFADEEETSFYFNPATGQLKSVRTNLWRFYDFMWMLHIMDYDTRNNFNHPLLYLFALGALIFSLSGFVLVYFRFTKRDFKWLKKSK